MKKSYIHGEELQHVEVSRYSSKERFKCSPGLFEGSFVLVVLSPWVVEPGPQAKVLC